MEIGDVVIVLESATTRRGTTELPAIVTHVYSDTEIDCAVIVGGSHPELICEENLKHESVQSRGKRFRLKGAT